MLRVLTKVTSCIVGTIIDVLIVDTISNALIL